MALDLYFFCVQKNKRKRKNDANQAGDDGAPTEDAAENNSMAKPKANADKNESDDESDDESPLQNGKFHNIVTHNFTYFQVNLRTLFPIC